MRCNVRLFLSNGRHHETYLPTFGRKTQAHPRFSRPHEEPRRPCRDQCAPRQGPQAPGRLSAPASVPGKSGAGQGKSGAQASSAVPADIVARLLRSRPGAVEDHFVMHWKSLPAPDAFASSAGVLFLSVPKRHLARAIDRNLVRRIAREAWRAAGLSGPPLAVMVKLRRRPEWFAAAGVRQRRRCLREELDRLFSSRSLARLSDTLRVDARP